MEIQLESVKDLLIRKKCALIESMARLKERELEIDKGIVDCEHAIKALDHTPDVGKKVDRLPKVGDELLAFYSGEFTTVDRPYKVTYNGDDSFWITDDRGENHSFSYETWMEFFQFKDEKTSKIA